MLVKYGNVESEIIKILGHNWNNRNIDLIKLLDFCLKNF